MLKKVVPTVGALVFRYNEVLLVRHKKGASHLADTYVLPSGRIKEDEGEKEAAIRELQEETALKTTIDNMVEYPGNLYHASIKRKGGEIVNFSWRVFIVKAFSGEPKASEETSPEWINVNQLEAYNLLPNVSRAVQDGLKFLRR